MLLGGLLATSDQAAASCTRPKAAAYYTYDYLSDSYVLQSVYDDGVDIGNGAPIDENGQPYEMLDGVWDFYPPPGWDGSYPPTHLFGNESGTKQEASGPTLSSGGICTKLPPVVVQGQRRTSSGMLRMSIVVRAPRNPSPGMEGVWYGESSLAKGIDQPDKFCDPDSATNDATCQSGCGSAQGFFCSFRVNHGQQLMVCQKQQQGPSTYRWTARACS